MTQSFFGFDHAQIAAVGAAVGGFLAAAYAAWRGYKAKPASGTPTPPVAPISEDVQDQLDLIGNRVEHTERKVDEALKLLHSIYTDTQVIRAIGSK